MSRDNDWTTGGDDSDEEIQYVNFALMASLNQEASSASNQVINTNLIKLMNALVLLSCLKIDKGSKQTH